MAEQSLPKLYAAAFVPGVILALLYIVTVLIVAFTAVLWLLYTGFDIWMDGLTKRIDRELAAVSVGTPAELEALVKRL